MAEGEPKEDKLEFYGEYSADDIMRAVMLELGPQAYENVQRRLREDRAFPENLRKIEDLPEAGDQ